MARAAVLPIGSVRSCGGLISRLAYVRAKQSKVDVASLLLQAGLDADIEAHDARLHVAGQIKFVDLVANAVGDPELGFHLATDSTFVRWNGYTSLRPLPMYWEMPCCDWSATPVL